MNKADVIHHARDALDLSKVELHAQTQRPVVAIDRRWCFPDHITLHVQVNPLTHKITVRHLADKEPLLELRRIESTTGDLFYAFDSATSPRAWTRARAGLLTSAITRGSTTIQFQDMELRRPSRVTVDGGTRDRVALVSVHHGVTWQPVARINRPEHEFFKLAYSTLEVAPGVDIMLPLVMWLSRWAVYELEQRIGLLKGTWTWHNTLNLHGRVFAPMVGVQNRWHFHKQNKAPTMYPSDPTAYTPSTAPLHAQRHEPVIAIDRRWCFAKPTTLHIEENPLSRKINVRDLATDTLLLEIHRIHSTVGDLFHVFDAATHEQILTIDGFGFRGCFDVFRGFHKPTTKRRTGPLLVDATCSHVTVYFNDAEARRPTRAIVDGRCNDRVAVVSVHHAVSSQAIARIHRPHHLWLKLPYYTINIAPGVDILVPIVLWLGRWVQFERQQLATAYRKIGSWGDIWM